MAYVFGAGTTGFGAITGWELQGVPVTKNKTVARVLNSEGTEAAIAAFNEIEELSATYKCSSNTNSVPSTLGAEVNGYVLTGIELSFTPDDYVTMVLTGHKHNAGTPAAPENTVAHGVTVDQALGIPATPMTGATTGNSGADWASVSIRIGCQHAELPGNLAGVTVAVAHENYDATIEFSATAASSITEPTGFTVTATTAPDAQNTQFQSYSLTAQKKLTLA